VVYTTFFPTTYFARQIGGDHFDVVCPLPPGADPITWRPSREQIAAYRRADLIIINGATFEQWTSTVSLPTSRVVDTTAAFSDEFVKYETVTHSHGPGGEHTHEGIDGHTWLDPINAKRQAQAILEAMVRVSPTDELSLRTAHMRLAADLDDLNERFESLTTRLGDRTVLCSHPAYNYIAKRYGWSIKNFDFDPESPLSSTDLTELSEAAPAILLWESDPLDATTSRLEQAGIVSVTFSPCEQIDPLVKDYTSRMRISLDRLSEAIDQLEAGGE
jgi:zinc transport system substrate-binding protein